MSILLYSIMSVFISSIVSVMKNNIFTRHFDINNKHYILLFSKQYENNFCLQIAVQQSNTHHRKRSLPGSSGSREATLKQ